MRQALFLLFREVGSHECKLPIRTGLLTAIKKTGLTAPDTVVADGKVHRLEVKWIKESERLVILLQTQNRAGYLVAGRICRKTILVPRCTFRQPNSEQFIKYNAEIKLLQEQWDAERVVAQNYPAKEPKEWADAEEPKTILIWIKRVGNYGLKLQGDRLVPIRDHWKVVFSAEDHFKR